MPKPYKTELPRKWRTWRESDILEFIATSYADADATGDLDEPLDYLIQDMLEELDDRDYEHETFTPDEWDDSPSLNMPSYSS
jgi:hypothetical protein